MIDAVPAWGDPEGSARADALFRSAFGMTPDGVWAAPGRVNLIGEHLDYNGGPCLPIALPHRTFVAVRRRDDSAVRLVSGIDSEVVWEGTVEDVAPGLAPSWVAYAAGPLWGLAAEGITTDSLGGFDAAIVSCVPVGAGLSSSAALECAVVLALDGLFGLGQVEQGDAGRARLAAACVRAENEVAGAMTGGMDQAAALRSVADHAMLLDSATGDVRLIHTDLAANGLVVLVVDTRAAHALNDGRYAARRRACEAAAQTLGLDTLAQIEDLGAALEILRDEEQGRLTRHVVTETRRVHEVAELFDARHLRQAGPLLTQSHVSLRDDYRVSCPELDLVVDAAIAAGALGARMTGGGFGGSAIALVEAEAAVGVAEAVATAFRARGYTDPETLIALPAEGARRIA